MYYHVLFSGKTWFCSKFGLDKVWQHMFKWILGLHTLVSADSKGELEDDHFLEKLI